LNALWACLNPPGLNNRATRIATPTEEIKSNNEEEVDELEAQLSK